MHLIENLYTFHYKTRLLVYDFLSTCGICNRIDGLNIDLFNLLCNLSGSLGRFIGKLAYLFRHNGKTASRISGTGGLDRCIE